jgi:hypothetical protein
MATIAHAAILRDAAQDARLLRVWPKKRPMFPGSRQPFENDSLSVMAGLRPGHPRLSCVIAVKTWMPGTRPGMTNQTASPIALDAFSASLSG